jgi:polar amino acid transport system substrate-binding protein
MPLPAPLAILPPLLLSMLAMPAAHAAEPITVAWREKPPYHYTDNGVERGFLLARGKLIFAQAGVAARFVEEPTKRIWANFQSGKTMYCSLGRYRLSERDAMGQYSIAMHVDPPQAILVSPSDLEKVRAHKNLVSLMTDPGLSVGLIDGVSYGPKFDALLARAGTERVQRTVDSASMMRMVAVGRVSYTLADRYGWEYQRERSPVLAQVTQVEFPDTPPGMTRHIMCSKDVPEATMRKLNRAIEAMKITERTPHEDLLPR